MLSHVCRCLRQLGPLVLLMLTTLIGLNVPSFAVPEAQAEAAAAPLNGSLPALVTAPVTSRHAEPLGLQRCAAGLSRVAPQQCQPCPDGFIEDGDSCRISAQLYVKASYVNGVGVPLGCAPGEALNGGLCYPRCAAGYREGGGPLCLEVCKAGYADHGLTCFRGIFDFYFKKSYGRGVGRAVSTCPAGFLRDSFGALCYPRCRTGFVQSGFTCIENCPAGFTNTNFGFCTRAAETRPKTICSAVQALSTRVINEAMPVSSNTTSTTDITSDAYLVFTANNTATLRFEPLTNDRDPSGRPLVMDSVSTPAQGSLALDGDTHLYQLRPDSSGVDTYTYTVRNDLGQVFTSTIQVTLQAPERADPATLDDDQDGVLNRDEDANGDGDWERDDSDGDTIPNFQDVNDDDDLLLTIDEGTGDVDNDGIPNFLDFDLPATRDINGRYLPFIRR